MRTREEKSLRPAQAGMVRELRYLFAILLTVTFFVSTARGEEDDVRSLELYNGSSVESVSVSRSPRPASQTAENITVVTSSEIEALNAHTLADVLLMVPGVQLEMIRTPGASVNIDLQGSTFNHILVLIDNVPINNLADNFPDVASVPVQMIERVEIVKGAASSSWGNALGGVINVITKSPSSERPFGGLASGSIGKRTTADARAELSGTVARFGYYLTGGKLRSDGLQPNNMVDLNTFYGKLHYDLPLKGSLTFTTDLTDGSSGETQLPTMRFNHENQQLISTLSFQYPFADRLSFEAMFGTRQFNLKEVARSRPDDSILKETKDEEGANRTSLKLSWFNDLQRILVGVDYDHVRAQITTPQVQGDLLNNSAERFGVYFNDTFTVGAFAITPSARYDHTGNGGDLFSPSFGITYALTDNSVLRGYTARGYSLTSLNRSGSTERVWTSQVGFETADIPYLWLKGTLFRNDTWNIATLASDSSSSKQRQLKQGVEVEARTLPVYGTSFSVGYTFIDAQDADTDAVIKGVARHTLDLGAKYEDSRHLRALLTGHYIYWNAAAGQGANYQDIIWDLYLGKKFLYSETSFIELFLSLRNLFNGQQYLFGYYKNPGAWLEGGLKCAF